MKRTMAIVLAALACVFCLAACTQETVAAPELTFAEEDNGLEVKQLLFSGEVGSVEEAGTWRETDGMLCLSEELLAGTAQKTEDGYLYTVPEAFFTLRKRENVEGILLYRGNAYGVAAADDGQPMICTLDETLETQTWTQFYNRALRGQKSDGEASGGTGLK